MKEHHVKIALSENEKYLSIGNEFSKNCYNDMLYLMPRN